MSEIPPSQGDKQTYRVSWMEQLQMLYIFQILVNSQTNSPRYSVNQRVISAKKMHLPKSASYWQDNFELLLEMKTVSSVLSTFI